MPTARTPKQPLARPRAVARGGLGAALLITLLLPALAAALPTAPGAERFEQRQDYRDALTALRTGNRGTYRRLRDSLQDYPLASYLAYAEAARTVRRLDWADIDNFRSTWPDNPMADRLEARWRSEMAERRRWQDLALSPAPNARATAARCHWHYARHTVAPDHAPAEADWRGEAMASAADLWLVGKSQPDACDRLFHLYTSSGAVTAALAWQRLQLALQAGNPGLARYLVRFIPEVDQGLAQLAVRLHQRPRELHNHPLLQPDTQAVRDVVLHSLRRLARPDPAKATRLWQQFQDSHDFDPDAAHDLGLTLAVEAIRDDLPAPLPDGGTHDGHPLDDRHTDWLTTLALAAVQREDWPAVLDHLALLPTHEAQRSRWRYWRARAMEATGAEPAAFSDLASQRNFYGFMSAHRLGQAPQLGQTPATADPVVLARVAALPAMQRARELLALGERVSARREWLALSRRLNDAELLAAANLAADWGWHRMAIQATIDAEAWNVLELRFPAAWQDLVLHRALATELRPDWLFAVARQESAFMVDARSSAGALGLMQVMPATARLTAKRHQLDYDNANDLLEPDTNITIGSAYLAEMYHRFGGNRALASAAYNAGPNRVERWVADANAVPLDVWIEGIPFRETREYVKNVLVYSWIYGQRLRQPRPFLEPHELEVHGT